MTLAQVKLLNLNMVLECLGCAHKRLMNVDELLKKWPAETTMKQIACAARCKNRGCRGIYRAEVLFRTGPYPDDWWPRLPMITRR
ncbi:MAG: hypothetical protein ACOZAM_22060 [Pseudomonadota bacterium]